MVTRCRRRPGDRDPPRELAMTEVEVHAEGDTRRAAAGPIGVAARRVGLSVDTLRVWERRYGLGPSRTSPGGHRRYEDGDLRRLRAAAHLLRTGVPASEAVRGVLPAAPSRPRVHAPDTGPR